MWLPGPAGILCRGGLKGKNNGCKLSWDSGCPGGAAHRGQFQLIIKSKR